MIGAPCFVFYFGLMKDAKRTRTTLPTNHPHTMAIADFKVKSSPLMI